MRNYVAASVGSVRCIRLNTLWSSERCWRMSRNNMSLRYFTCWLVATLLFHYSLSDACTGLLLTSTDLICKKKNRLFLSIPKWVMILPPQHIYKLILRASKYRRIVAEQSLSVGAVLSVICDAFVFLAVIRVHQSTDGVGTHWTKGGTPVSPFL